MNLSNLIKQVGSNASYKATYILSRIGFLAPGRVSVSVVIPRIQLQVLNRSVKNLNIDGLKLSSIKDRYNFKSHRRDGHPYYIFFGGILSFIGVDEDSKKERQYDREVESNKENDFDETLKNILRPAILNMQEGEYDKAEHIFHIALKMAQDVQHQDAILYIHDLLANLAYEMGDLKKAEKLFIDVMQRQIGQKGVAQDDNSIIAMSLKCASIFGQTEQHEKAQQGFEFCIDTTEKKIKSGIRDEDTMVLWGMSRDVYAQYLMSIGRNKSAREQFKQAYDISCEVNGETDQQSLVLLNSLGTVSAAMGENKVAQEYFEEVIQKARVSESDHLAHFLVNYGMLNIQMDLLSWAKKYCSEALVLAKRKGDGEAYEQSQKCLKLITEGTSRAKSAKKT